MGITETRIAVTVLCCIIAHLMWKMIDNNRNNRFEDEEGIESIVSDIIKENICDDGIARFYYTDDLVDLCIDTIDLANIGIALDTRFGIYTEIDELEKLVTVEDVVGYVKSLLGEPVVA